MSGFDSARAGTPVEVLDAWPRMTARVTTTIALPPDALTVVAPPPEMISQLNVEQVLGLPSRAYLELLREPGFPFVVTSVGKLRLVDRNEFRRWLVARGRAKRAAATSRGAAVAAPNEDEELPVEEQARLGIKPAPRAAGRR